MNESGFCESQHMQDMEMPEVLDMFRSSASPPTIPLWSSSLQSSVSWICDDTVRSLVTLCHIVPQPRAQISLSSQHGVCEVIYFLITEESCPRLWSTWSTSDLLNIYISVLCLAGKATEGWRQVQWPFHHFVCATRWHVLWGLLLVHSVYMSLISVFLPPTFTSYLPPSPALSLFISLYYLSHPFPHLNSLPSIPSPPLSLPSISISPFSLYVLPPLLSSWTRMLLSRCRWYAKLPLEKNQIQYWSAILHFTHIIALWVNIFFKWHLHCFNMDMFMRSYDICTPLSPHELWQFAMLQMRLINIVCHECVLITSTGHEHVDWW